MSERLIHVRGIDIHVEMNGDESLPAIVLLHGFTGSTATWKRFSERFTGNYRTVAIDLIWSRQDNGACGCFSLFDGAATRGS